MTTIRHIPALTNDLARAMVDAALAAADRSYTVAVVDAGGHLSAFARMDGAPVITIQVATDKAYTAAGFGLATDAWHDMIAGDPPLAAGAPAPARGPRPHRAAARRQVRVKIRRPAPTS